jgi:gliding motility-associated-like protein
VWFKNGMQVGQNSASYTDSMLVINDVINCNLISNIEDSGTVVIRSNTIKMMVFYTKAGFTITENFSNIIGNILFNNTSTDADSFYWDFGNGQTSTSTNPSVTYETDGTFLILLTAMNKLNCVDTISLKYEMLFKGLFIPNAFAPGATATLGSVFQPAGISLKKYKIEVYDNWGHLMWESSKLDGNGTPTESWDGTYQGTPMPQGTYLWKVHAIFFDDTIWLGSDNGFGKGSTMGTVLLIR